MGIFLPDPVENGKLYTFDYAKTGLSDDEALKELTFINFPSQSNFHSLGMAYDEPTSTLLVTNHRRHAPPAIEMFHLDLAAHTATHLRSVQHPLLHAPNAVALVSHSEFYVTNDHHFLVRAHPVLSRLETNLGLPGGSVVHVDVAADPPRASVVARLAFANGIALLNATTAAVSSSSKARVHLFSIGRGAGALDPPRFAPAADFRVPFSPDNLALARNGALLVAGHPHPPSLSKFAASRNVCNDPEALGAADEEVREMCGTLVVPSWAARWTQEGGLETVYAGVEYPTSATAAWDSDRGVGVISGLYAKGVFVWRD
ncbi:putative paraoxonase [Nemania diffusa]|nr:putative paraoxonase [Nemania diffusa]